MPGLLPPCPGLKTSLAAPTSPRRSSSFRWELGGACWGSCSLMAGDEERSQGDPTWEVKDLARSSQELLRVRSSEPDLRLAAT